MTTYADWAMLRPRSTNLDRFYGNDVNFLPTDGGMGPVRLHGGIGMSGDTKFDFRTRGENDTDGLTSWVHSGDEGNNVFLPTASATLTAPINDTDTTIPVSAVVAFADGEHVKINDEMILIGTVSGSDLIGCTRGQLGTTAASHLSGDGVQAQIGTGYGSRIWYAQGQAAFFWDTDQGFAASFAGISTDGSGGGQTLFARLDSSNAHVEMWAGYDEIIRGAGTAGQGSGWGREIGVMNAAGPHPLGTSYMGGRPYNQGWDGQTIGLMIQSGGGNTNMYTADNPLVFSTAGSDFHRGLTVEVGSITNPEGERSEAMILPDDYTLTWDDANGVRALDIFSTIDNAATKAQELLFSDTGLTYRSRVTGGGFFRVDQVDNAVNYVTIVPAVTGDSVRIKADGTGSNGNLILETRAGGIAGVSYDSTAASTPGNFSADRYLAVEINGSTAYIPVMNSTW